VRLYFNDKVEVPRPHFTIGIHDGKTGLLIEATMLIDGQAPVSIHGRGAVTCHFHSVPLMPRIYHLWGEVRDQKRYAKIVPWQPLGSFQITDITFGPNSEYISQRHLRDSAPVRIQYSWEFTEE
jgi:hypothetical protein